MIQVSVVGKCSRVSKRLIRQAVEFYASILMTSRLANNLLIQVQFKPIWETDGHVGTAIQMHNADQHPRDFFIEVEPNQSRKQIFLTLAHEMTHVKQYVMGELKYYLKPVNRVRFKDEFFDNDKYINEPREYWLCPWEIEAYGKQIGLYALFQLNLKKEKEKENGNN